MRSIDHCRCDAEYRCLGTTEDECCPKTTTHCESQSHMPIFLLHGHDKGAISFPTASAVVDLEVEAEERRRFACEKRVFCY